MYFRLAILMYTKAEAGGRKDSRENNTSIITFTERLGYIRGAQRRDVAYAINAPYKVHL